VKDLQLLTEVKLLHSLSGTCDHLFCVGSDPGRGKERVQKFAGAVMNLSVGREESIAKDRDEIPHEPFPPGEIFGILHQNVLVRLGTDDPDHLNPAQKASRKDRTVGLIVTHKFAQGILEGANNLEKPDIGEDPRSRRKLVTKGMEAKLHKTLL
jgi:hypothetical protein